MNIVLCDDNDAIFEKTETIFREYLDSIGQSCEFYAFKEAAALINFCKGAHEPIDLLLMDIEMPQVNGIELCKEIKKIEPSCQIAYYTNYIGYATDVYDTYHCYYLLKDQLSDRIAGVVKKVLQNQKSARQQIVLKQKGRETIVFQDEILFIERLGRKSHLHFCDGTVICTYEGLEDLLRLLDALTFVRCHNSYIISFSKVKELSRYKLLTENDISIPISRKYTKIVKRAFGIWAETQL